MSVCISMKFFTKELLREFWQEGGGGVGGSAEETTNNIKIQLLKLIEVRWKKFISRLSGDSEPARIIRYKDDGSGRSFIPAALAEWGGATRQSLWCTWRIRSSPRNTCLDLQTSARWHWPKQRKHKDKKVWNGLASVRLLNLGRRCLCVCVWVCEGCSALKTKFAQNRTRVEEGGAYEYLSISRSFGSLVYYMPVSVPDD